MDRLPHAVAIALLFFCAAAAAQPMAYVANEKSGTVSVVDTAADKVVAEIATGGKPRGMALSPDGQRLYVSEQSKNALLVVDTSTREVLQEIELGQSPEGIDISPDGRLLAAASEATNAVLLVDTAAGRIAAAINTSGKNPEHAVFS